jgi:hypothetical protein
MGQSIFHRLPRDIKVRIERKERISSGRLSAAPPWERPPQLRPIAPYASFRP